MPTLFRRSNGVYYIVYADQDGRRKWISTGQRRKALALKKLFDFTDYKTKRKPSVRLEEFVNEFLSVAQNLLAPGTLDIYKKSLRKFMEQAGNIPLASVTQKHIDLFRHKRLKEVSRVTVNIELRTLRATFYTAVRWKVIESNPFAGVELCAIDEEVPAYFTVSDFHKLISAAREEWFRDVVLVAGFTGMRRGEILNLRWEDVDLRSRLLLIRSHGKFRTKAGKRRIMPMNRFLVEIFARRSREKVADYVFTIDGHQISERWLTRKFKRHIRRLGLDDRLHFHSLRHSFASWLVQEGASLYEVQKLLGHSSIRVTEIYSHLAPEELRKTVERIPVELN